MSSKFRKFGALLALLIAVVVFAASSVGAGATSLLHAGINCRIIHSFTYPHGLAPSAPLVASLSPSDPELYSVTKSGGALGGGTIVTVDPNTAVVTDIYDFPQAGSPAASTIGNHPAVHLLPLADGSFLGVTGGGGASNFGTLFHFTPGATPTLVVLHSFMPAEGYSTALILASDGNYYGATQGNTGGGYGVIYRASISGNTATTTILHTFAVLEGAQPNELVEYPTGVLFGSSYSGGQFGQGSLYRYVMATSSFQVLHSFASPDGVDPNSALVPRADGFLYGTTISDANLKRGTIFKASTSGLVVTVLRFGETGNSSNGASPNSLTLDPTSGNLVGTTSAGGDFGDGTVFSLDQSEALTSLISFSFVDGSGPVGVFLKAGGTSAVVPCLTGGSGAAGSVLILSVTPTVATITASTPFDAPEGVLPASSLTQFGTNLVGTNSAGGSNGTGAIYVISPSGNASALISFDALNNNDNKFGAFPNEALVGDGKGNFYGTCEYGGANGTGTVFQLSPVGGEWVLTTLASFGAVADDGNNSTGAYPHCSLTMENGTLLGTALLGGANGSGTIYSLDPADIYSPTHDFTTMYSFSAVASGGATTNSDGAYPNTLIHSQGNGNGNLYYGTTQSGGDNGYGTIFSFDPAGGPGSVKTLHAFDYTDGSGSSAGLSLSLDGTTLYGTTQYGGSGTGGQYGTIFAFTPGTSTLETLVNCDGSTTGAYPTASLLTIPTGIPGNPDVVQPDAISRGGYLLGGTFSGSGTSDNAVSKPLIRTPQQMLREFASGIATPDTIPSGGTNYTINTTVQTVDARTINLWDYNGVNGSNPNSQPISIGDGFYYATTEYGGLGFGAVIQITDPILSGVSHKLINLNASYSLTVYGSGFVPSSVVDYNNTPLTPSVAIAPPYTSITVNVPSSVNSKTGSIPIFVLAPDGTYSSPQYVTVQ